MKGFLTAIILALQALSASAQRLDVEFDLTFGSRPLAFDALAFDSTSKQTLSLTRCDLLLSGAALQQPDGTWIDAEKWAACISGRAARTRFNLSGIPAGKYTRLRFNIGLPPELNHGDPATWPAGHPLNPSVNGLHWGWQGGYVFAAIEGLWKTPAGSISGYSLHLAENPEAPGTLVTVELPLALDLSRDQTVKLTLDLQSLLNGITLTPDDSTSHSRAGDPIAAKLRENFPHAFRIGTLTATPSRAQVAQRTQALISATAHPFRFTFSSQFPRPSLPPDNPLTVEGVALGKRLFRERRLSGNGTQDCMACHHPPLGFSDRRPFSIDAFGDIGKRQSMPLANLAWRSSFFWDGRASTLRQQVLMPIEDRTEMHASLPEVARMLADDPEYPEMFESAFGSPKIDADRIARALEQFLLTLVSDDSKFDRSLRGEENLTDEEQLGFKLFNTEYDPQRGQRGADCFHCHGGPLFQSTAFANNGLDGPAPPDIGLEKTTKLPGDRGKFAVPSLRNLTITAPYMHDGRFETLEEVINHYDHGLHRSSTLDPNLAKHPAEGLHLTMEEKSALVAFLKTLTSESALRLPPPRGGRRPPPPPPPRPPRLRR